MTLMAWMRIEGAGQQFVYATFNPQCFAMGTKPRSLWRRRTLRHRHPPSALESENVVSAMVSIVL